MFFLCRETGELRGTCYIDFATAEGKAKAAELTGTACAGGELYVDPNVKPKADFAAGGGGFGGRGGGRGGGRDGGRGGGRGGGRSFGGRDGGRGGGRGFGGRDGGRGGGRGRSPGMRIESGGGGAGKKTTFD